MNIAVLLSGCGVYDGAEIHESVLSLLALKMQHLNYQCVAPNRSQKHVVNHLDGSEMTEDRNILTEAARIARGDIKAIDSVSVQDFDALWIPGGFGAAKNFTEWAFMGPEGKIHEDVKTFILGFIESKKPIVALCMAPTTLAKSLASTSVNATLSVGNTTDVSPYDIGAISDGMNSLGAKAEMSNSGKTVFDASNKIISVPCYMMEVGIVDIWNEIQMAAEQLKSLLEEK